MRRELRIEDVQKLLTKACEEAGGQTAFAEAHGFNRQFIIQVLKGVRPPSDRLCEALKIKPDGMRWVMAKG